MSPLAKLLVIMTASSGLAVSEDCPSLNNANSPLRSSKFIDRAWGAYSALRDHDRSCQTALITALREAIPLRNSAIDSEAYAYVQSLFDALIQLGGPVPSDVLLPFRYQSRAEVLLILARSPGNERDLLAMMDEDINTAEWLAICNLLFQKRSREFFQKTLSEVAITHTFEIKDFDGFAGRCGGAIGSASAPRHFPNGFPPIALYQLDFPQMSGRGPDDEVLAFPGPRDIYYRRAVIATGTEETWTHLNFFHYLDVYRSEYLAAGLTGMSSQDLNKVLFPLSSIRWQNAERFNQQAAEQLDRQADQIRELLMEMREHGLDVQALSLHIAPIIYDYRNDKDEPLPSLTPKGISLR